MNTINTRKKIGFPSKREAWNMAPALFKKHTLKIAGHPVMEDWERDYMDALAEIATTNGGTVLELGYGMGLSAHAIQTADIDTHHVIECHPDVLAKGMRDFRHEVENGRIHFLSGFWEEVTPILKSESYDGILFDTYPLREEEIHSNHFEFFKEAYRLLKPGGVLTYYSDEARTISPKHHAKLLEAGFKAADIDLKVCDVDPPADCEYWQEKTIVAPIVKKSAA